MSTAARLCRIGQALGRSELCPEDACPFWESGSDKSPGRCAVDELDLGGRRQLAEWLARLRDDLELEAAGADVGARRRFFERLNAARGD